MSVFWSIASSTGMVTYWGGTLCILCLLSAWECTLPCAVAEVMTSHTRMHAHTYTHTHTLTHTHTHTHTRTHTHTHTHTHIYITWAVSKLGVSAWHYCSLLLLSGQHKRHCPTHKLHNVVRAVWLLLSVQYQQKPSADTVERQRTAWYRPRSNNKPFNVSEFVLYEIYGVRVCGRVADTQSQVLYHATRPQPECHKSRNALLTNIKWFIVAPWPTSSCVLTFDSVYWRFLLILHRRYSTR